MCMTSLDNTGDSRAATSKLLGKIVYLLFSGIVAIGLVGCHKTTVLPPRAESATDSIRDADHLYSEREDLLKVRQAIVILRQAQAVDPSNYEIAWRLAEYNYDLGSSTTNDAEKEGINLSESFAYSDSMSDLPMLSIVGHPAAVNPDFRLRQTALHHDWPILNLK